MAPNRLRQYEAEKAKWEAMKSAFVAGVHTALMRDMSCSSYFAYVKPSTAKEYGVLAFVREDAEPETGFELVTAERIPPGTKEQIRHWFERHAGRLPVYPSGV